MQTASFHDLSVIIAHPYLSTVGVEFVISRRGNTETSSIFLTLRFAQYEPYQGTETYRHWGVIVRISSEDLQEVMNIILPKLNPSHWHTSPIVGGMGWHSIRVNTAQYGVNWLTLQELKDKLLSK